MTSSPAGSSRAARSRSGRACRASSPASTSATAIMSARGNCCSPSTRGRSRPSWPRRRPAPRRRARRPQLAGRAARRARSGCCPKGFVSRDDFDSLPGRRPLGPGEHRRRRCGRPPARARPRVHPRPRADQRPDLLPPDRSRAPWSAAATAATATLLTTINAVDPIYFTFDVSEALLLKTQRERAAGADRAAAGRDPPPGRARLSLARPGRFHRQRHRSQFGHDPRPRRGRQSDGFLTPGMFGSMRLSSRPAGQRPAGARQRGA